MFELVPIAAGAGAVVAAAAVMVGLKGALHTFVHRPLGDSRAYPLTPVHPFFAEHAGTCARDAGGGRHVW